jgi:RHS repeat-associated protein
MVNGYTSSFEGIATSNVYNDRLQPILLSASVSSTAILSLCYDFHLGVAINSGLCSLNKYTTGNNGNLFQVLDQVNSNLSAAFLYDPLNRISQANTLTAGTDCWAEAYTIDAWGNLTNRAGVSGYNGCSTEGLNASANTNNQLSILTYDNAGNVTNDGNGNQPTYDAENRISVDAGVTYYYDADGMRTEKSSGTKYWPGPGGEVLAETDLDGNINEEYIYFDGARIARVDRPSGTVHYYFSDHLGSASVITDALGNVEQRDYYFPYGGIAYSSGSDPNHYKFTGKERDTESNLDNFGARYYTSNIGRFMTPDWAARATAVPYAVFGDPQTLNLYTYVENAPVNRADADGHSGSNPDVYLPMYGGSINVSAQWFQSLVAAFGAAATPLAEDQAKAQHKPAQTNQINTKPPTADPAGTRTDPKLNPQPDSSKKTSPPTTCTTNCHVTVAVQHGVTQVDNEGTVSLVAPPAVAVNVNVNLHGAAPDQTLLATPSVGLGKWVAVGTDVVKDSSGVHDQGGSVSFGASWPPWPASVSSPASNFTPSGDNWQIGVAQTYPW